MRAPQAKYVTYRFYAKSIEWPCHRFIGQSGHCLSARRFQSPTSQHRRDQDAEQWFRLPGKDIIVWIKASWGHPSATKQ